MMAENLGFSVMEKNQKNRFREFTLKLKNEIESIEKLSNGIHTISEFEKITTNLV